MCGIFGHTNFNKKNIQHSRNALDTLSHRGPDQWSDWSDEDIYMGHRRLSILDISDNGKQPMFDENNTVVISVNGEIYNYKELREELYEFKFKSESDSEVVLYGFKKWGIEKLLSKIEGMYSISIYDVKSKDIYLIRDRVGIKPLYYSFIKDTLAWGSELKSLQYFHKNNSLDIDKTALYDFLTYNYIPEPKTPYKNVYKLEPGSYLRFNLRSGSLSINKYWSLSVKFNNSNLSECADKIRNIIDESVSSHLVSDVPVGFFLSGGMDSSIVVSTSSKFTKQLNTYSIGYKDNEKDETEYALLVSEKFKTKHSVKYLESKDISSLFSKLKSWYDEPFSDTSAFPTYYVSEFARKDSTVVLTGDGGDEIFGGYVWYNSIWNESKKLKNIFIDKFNPTLSDNNIFTLYIKHISGLTKEEKFEYRKLWNIPRDYDDYWYIRKYYKKDLPLRTRLQYMDFNTYLPSDILTKVDRVSMSVALEVRVPLQSRKLIEYMFTVPEEIKYLNGELKGLLKYAYKDILPNKIINRAKKGFSIPLGSWKRELFNDFKGKIQIYILNNLFQELVNN